MKLDDVPRLGVESDDVHPSGEGLKVGVGAGDAAEFVHHIEGVFVAVEVEGLEAGASACFIVGDSRFAGGFDGRHEILGENAGSQDGLEAVAERSDHEVYFFHLK